MLLRILVCATILAIGFTGCAHPEKDKAKDAKAAEAAKKKKAKEEEKKFSIKDVNGDTSFQAFVGHLRTAVARKDRSEMSSLMAPDFGYRFDQRPEGETPFDYWDQHGMWGELESVLGQHFQPKGDYMVSPPKFVDDENYRGPRAGLRLVNGGWKFAYFVTGEDILQ